MSAAPAADPVTADLLDRAAAMRAAGTDWARVAARLGRDEDELRELAHDHGAGFRARVSAARAEVVAEGFAEAVLLLRKLLRSDDERVSGKAADGLARIWMTTRRHRRKGTKPPPPVDATRLVPLTVVVATLLVVMGAVLLLADVFNPVNIFGG